MTASCRCRSFSPRTLFVLIAVCALVSVYVGSYYRLSRRGMREAAANGMAGFLYIPLEGAVAKEDLTDHYRLAAFYGPINWIDRALFGGDDPLRGILWHLE